MVFFLFGGKYYVVVCDVEGFIVRYFEWFVEGNIVYYRSGDEFGKFYFEIILRSKYLIIIINLVF